MAKCKRCNAVIKNSNVICAKCSLLFEECVFCQGLRLDVFDKRDDRDNITECRECYYKITGEDYRDYIRD